MARAAEAGVKGIVAIGMDLASCEKLLAIKSQYTRPKVYIGFGMHPSEANAADLDAVVKNIYAHRDELTVVGEVGLDFWYKWVRKDDAKKAEQRAVYRRLLEVAKDVDLPAVIHSRGCWRECLDTALEVGIIRSEFHWYSGPVDVLNDVIQAGYYVSTSPSVAYSPQSREAMAAAPIEKTLIETDSPVFYKDRKSDEDGFKAEPKDVIKTWQAYCRLKQIDPDEGLTILNQNAEQFFQLS